MLIKKQNHKFINKILKVNSFTSSGWSKNSIKMLTFISFGIPTYVLYQPYFGEVVVLINT